MLFTGLYPNDEQRTPRTEHATKTSGLTSGHAARTGRATMARHSDDSRSMTANAAKLTSDLSVFWQRPLTKYARSKAPLHFDPQGHLTKANSLQT